MRRTLLTAALLLAAGPAFAVNPAVTEVTCAAAVTEGQAVRDLKPSFLPVLPYKQEPGDKEFKQLAMFGDVPVRLYVYRVNEQMLRVRIFEDGPAGRELLADTDLDGEMTQLSYRPIGGDRMVTAYCYGRITPLNRPVRISISRAGHIKGVNMGLPEKQETIEGYTMGNMDTRSIVIFLVIGLVAGFLAGLVVGGGNILMYLVWGILGSFVGGFLFSALKINLGIRNPIVTQIITATVGAIIVVIVARLIGG